MKTKLEYTPIEPRNVQKNPKVGFLKRSTNNLRQNKRRQNAAEKIAYFGITKNM